MNRTLLSLLLMLIMSFSTISAQSFFTFKSELELPQSDERSIVVNGMSSDGKYVIGNVAYDKYVPALGGSYPGYYFFTWTKEDGIKEWDFDKMDYNLKGSSGMAVSTSGKIVGISGSPDYIEYMEAIDLDALEFIEDAPMKIHTAAINQYGEETWSHLPILDGVGLRYEVDGNYAYGITADESIIVGGFGPGGTANRKIAGYWKMDGEEVEMVQLMDDINSGAGSLVKSVSADGRIMGGYYSADNSYVLYPALWIEGERVEIENINAEGEVTAISPNGKYAALNLGNRAAILDIEKGTYKYLDVEGDPCMAYAISDEGVVVGYWMTNSGSYAKAFVYVSSRGMIDVDKLLDESGVEYPEEFNFLGVTGISVDGTIITGFGNLDGEQVGFYAEISEINDGLYPVVDIRVLNNKYGEITINWSEPDENIESVELTGYQLYCNGASLAIVEAETTTYTHHVSADGIYKYYVVAQYGEDQSRESEVKTVTMGIGSLPYFETFDYEFGDNEGLSKHGNWDVSTNTISIDNNWRVSESGYPPNSAFFRVPTIGEYSETLTSPFFDARGTEELYLNFVVVISSRGETHKLSIDVFDGEKWEELEELAATLEPGEFYAKRYTITEYAANKENIRVRFRAHGEADSRSVHWIIDNVEIADESQSLQHPDPLALQVTQDKETGNVIINWVGPTGTAILRYVDSEKWNATIVGNKGIPFIAANMFPAEDMAIYDGYLLTQLSFMPSEHTPDSVDSAKKKPAQYKWFVSQGEERLYAKDVTEKIEDREWTVVKLDNPITIDGSKPLYYGVEIVSYEPYDLPIATSDIYTNTYINEAVTLTESVDAADGRGNIYSTDGGVTWERLPHYIDDEYLIPIYHLFNVSATLSKEPVVESQSHFSGYKVLRNGENLIGKLYQTTTNNHTRKTMYIDYQPLADGEQACYEVIAHYITLVDSDPLSVCITIDDIRTYEKEETGVSVYPNPMVKGGTITIQLNSEELVYGESIRIYSAAGMLVKEEMITGKTTSLTMDFPAGIYFLKVKNEVLKIAVE